MDGLPHPIRNHNKKGLVCPPEKREGSSKGTYGSLEKGASGGTVGSLEWFPGEN